MSATDHDLHGKVALVTGASRGIGRAIATRLAGDGASVAVGYHQGRRDAEELCRRLADDGGEGIPVGGDVADPAAIAAMVDAVEEGLGPVDILVSNAGSVRQRSLEQLDLAEWERTMAEHLRAAFLLSQRVVPGMRERHWGRLVFISSVAAFNGGLVGPHYTAAKAGLIGLARSLAVTLAPHGVTVNAVAPALIETAAVHGLDEDLQGELAGRIPVGRLGRPEEVADLVAAVVRNPFLTGQSLLIDGGLWPR